MIYITLCMASSNFFFLRYALRAFAEVLAKMTVAVLKKVCRSATGMHPAMQQHLKWK